MISNLHRGHYTSGSENLAVKLSKASEALRPSLMLKIRTCESNKPYVLTKYVTVPHNEIQDGFKSSSRTLYVGLRKSGRKVGYVRPTNMGFFSYFLR